MRKGGKKTNTENEGEPTTMRGRKVTTARRNGEREGRKRERGGRWSRSLFVPYFCSWQRSPGGGVTLSQIFTLIALHFQCYCITFQREAMICERIWGGYPHLLFSFIVFVLSSLLSYDHQRKSYYLIVLPKGNSEPSRPPLPSRMQNCYVILGRTNVRLNAK